VFEAQFIVRVHRRLLLLRTLKTTAYLQATGRIIGRVIDADGSAIGTAIRLQLRASGGAFATVEIPNGSSFNFDLVPVGNVEVHAERISDGNRGIAYVRIASAGEIKNIDLRMIGLGSLRVALVDANNQPVSGAKVTVSTQVPFYYRREIESTASGVVSFANVPAGDFSISAIKPLQPSPLTGNASGTLSPNSVQDLTVTMTSQPVGIVRGVLFRPDGVTPFGAGMVMRMLPEPFPDAYVTTTDVNGTYQFSNVVAGTYTIDAIRFYNPNACPNRDRIRARATGITLTTQGQQVVANAQLIGNGIVRGVIRNADGLGVGGIRVTMTNPDPVYGFNVTCNGLTTYITTTDSLGNYSFLDAPPGNFTLLAQNANASLRAEGADRVEFDGDEVLLDLTLINSAITMPYTFYDANGFRFDINGIGAIANEPTTCLPALLLTMPGCAWKLASMVSKCHSKMATAPLAS
jgi:hypothetical protein